MSFLSSRLFSPFLFSFPFEDTRRARVTCATRSDFRLTRGLPLSTRNAGPLEDIATTGSRGHFARARGTVSYYIRYVVTWPLLSPAD